MTAGPMKVLCVEDEPDHADLLRSALERIDDLNFEFRVMSNPDGVPATLAGSWFDLVFLDYRLGAVTGLDVLRAIRSRGFNHAVIMLTSHGDEYLAAEVTRAGADDYLVKSDLSPERLSAVIARACANRSDRVAGEKLSERVRNLETLSRELAENNARIAIESRTDPLTELLNRAAMDEAVAIEDETARVSGYTYAVVLLDIDHFKKLNDSAGHRAGDEALRSVAHSLRAAARSADFVGRYGGEEFLVLLCGAKQGDAMRAAERMLEAVRSEAIPNPGVGSEATVTISAGLALGPAGADWTSVVDAADAALYRAKNSGRNRLAIAEDNSLREAS